MISRLAPPSAFCAAALLLAAGSPALAAPPANDLRANAIAVTFPGTTNGTLAQATNTEAMAGACGISTNSPDVWYIINATTNDGAKFSTCGGASWDTVLQAFENVGGTVGAQVACNDDDSSCGTRSSIIWALQAGHSYYVRVATYQNSTSGSTFTMTSTAVVPPAPAQIGPDVTVGACYDFANYGTQSMAIQGLGTQTVRGFAVGTNSWNKGDRPIAWYDGTTRHPVIGQNMYRLLNGKFEQVGLSWLKHGFASTNSSDFGACQSPPDGGDQLGVNCADLYGTSLNGSRSYLGPRFDINPMTGAFTADWATLVGPTPTGAASRRLTVLDSDWNNAGASYWVDTQYVTADDANWNNHRNNISARKLSGGTFPTGNSGTIQRTTALEAWVAEANTATPGSVQLATVDFHEMDQTGIDPLAGPSQLKHSTGRFLVSSKVTDNGNGTWNYEYAIMNINSHRAGANFRMRLPAGAVVTGEGFHAPFYHSGDRIDNSPWLNSKAGGSIKFNYNPSFTSTMTITPGPGLVTVQPNYLYWGTLYNVRFTANVAPMTGVARLGLGRGPADAAGYQGDTLAVSGVKVPAICIADMGQQGGTAGADALLDNNDFVVFIDAFFSNDMLLADVGMQGGIAGADNLLDNNDFVVFINAFFGICL